MLLGFCFLPVLLHAQSITGSLTGSIIDPTDAAIAGASLTLRNSATGAERALTSDQAGRFFFGTLQPGSYTLSIEQAGFKRFERTEIPVSAAATVSLGDIRLEVGQTTETVEVRSQSALVQTQTSERAGVLTGSQVESLALRDFGCMCGHQIVLTVVHSIRGVLFASYRVALKNRLGPAIGDPILPSTYRAVLLSRFLNPPRSQDGNTRDSIRRTVNWPSDNSLSKRDVEKL